MEPSRQFKSISYLEPGSVVEPVSRSVWYVDRRKERGLVLPWAECIVLIGFVLVIEPTESLRGCFRARPLGVLEGMLSSKSIVSLHMWPVTQQQ